MRRTLRRRAVARLLVATSLAAGSGALADPPRGEAEPAQLVAFLMPNHVPGDLVLQALAPAPSLVVRRTGYYGNVTIDHRAHLARRTTCKACHGPGPVTKIVFTPRVAHERCVGCHTVAARGPTECKGCHVMPPPEAPPTVAAAPAPQAAAGQDQGLAAYLGPPIEASADAIRSAFGRQVGIGFAAGSAFGPAVHLSSRSGGTVLEHSVDRVSGGDDVRTRVLVGGGIARPLRRDLDLVAIGLGGLDAAERPAAAVMPALGARLGLEWAAPPSWRVYRVRLSLTGVVDVANRRALGRDVGGTRVYATLGTTFRLRAR